MREWERVRARVRERERVKLEDEGKGEGEGEATFDWLFWEKRFERSGTLSLLVR